MIDGLKDFFISTQLFMIVVNSLVVSCMATFISTVITLPIGITLGIREYKLKGVVGRVLYTFISIPSVVVGLLVAMALSRKGFLGGFQLLYTVTGMIIAQTFLLMPLLMALFFDMAKNRGKEIEQIATTLGANFFQKIVLIIKELRLTVVISIVTAFSKGISEVGAVSIVGGNIAGHTRVMTTSIIMFQSMGDYNKALALGGILLLISLIINSFLYTTTR